jgi:hypothetical protein
VTRAALTRCCEETILPYKPLNAPHTTAPNSEICARVWGNASPAPLCLTTQLTFAQESERFPRRVSHSAMILTIDVPKRVCPGLSSIAAALNICSRSSGAGRVSTEGSWENIERSWQGLDNENILIYPISCAIQMIVGECSCSYNIIS